MRKYLLSKEGKFYKANLHTHSTVSDGSMTPKQVKKVYQEKGYSVVAFTDHNIMIDHSDLCDENFIALNGLELDFYEGWNTDFVSKGYSYYTWKGVHLVFIALSPDNLIQPCYRREGLRALGNAFKYVDQIKFDETKPDFIRYYTAENVNKALKEGHDTGFYTIYAHPRWNNEDYRDYSQYENLNAMEICNFGTYRAGMDEYNPHVYDDLLRMGKKISCLSTDDAHGAYAIDSVKTDVGGGFTMIKSEKLDYKSITANLLKGNCYASMGPEIYELYYEDGQIHIKCSPVSVIALTTAGRRVSNAFDESGNGVTEATFPVYEEDYFVRITLRDSRGLRANTNAYFVEDLFKE
ncbi:MAG: hypothetical protein IJB32_04875 [Clostridia bacterium]|nr:hypothetical protein [Clostridia bacterium]